jgi:hypothetical protein
MAHRKITTPGETTGLCLSAEAIQFCNDGLDSGSVNPHVAGTPRCRTVLQIEREQLSFDVSCGQGSCANVNHNAQADSHGIARQIAP